MHSSLDTSVLSNVSSRTRFCHGILLDLQQGRAFAGEVDLGLSPAEFNLLNVLFQSRGIPMSKEAIGAALPVQVEPCMIDVYVSRARAKLAAAGLAGTIETVWGRGYMAPDSDGSRPPTSPRHSPALVCA